MILNHNLITLSLLLISSQILLSSAFNLSTIFISSNSFPTDPPPPHFLHDILKSIALKKKWKLEDIRISKITNSQTRTSQKYEFRIRIGKSDLLFRFSEELNNSWRMLKKNGEFGSLLSGISSKAVLGKFELNGPFELRVGGDDELNLTLPSNTTHSGLKRLIVGEGITVTVEGAREISLFHLSDFGLPIHRSRGNSEDRNHYWPSREYSCMPLPPIHILGSASLLTYRTRNRNAYIETRFLSAGILQLLPEKCYSGPSYKKRACSINNISERLDLLEKLMKSILGDRLRQNGKQGFLRAKITASSVVRFELELERDIWDDDLYWGTLAEWRSKPTAERIQFEVVARMEGERLMPLVVKKVKPLISAHSTTWSTLMSNMSFTKFPSFVVPPEVLTLDV
ncbi:hypothetical protein IFM89_032065 [Coptis chinensis]|uniref:Uncharacterized protein n=1 Tax=Coptis chinensis TaxID=261450 RepID=A0A835M5F3_9MAGN|nr:hypothetical protein IFM89_032065 [Coptis chinensis]